VIEDDDFGKRLKELRTSKGLSAYRISQLTGLTRQAISAFELGHALPAWNVAIRLAKALGISLDDLAGVLPDQPEAPPPKPRGRPPKVEKPVEKQAPRPKRTRKPKGKA
jgi:transcriptional regulator with XRE-family HTH domain